LTKKQWRRCKPLAYMNPTVMPGLVPGIHVFRATMKKDVGGPAWASGSDAVLRTAMPGHGENV